MKKTENYKPMTFRDLVGRMEKNGCNLADVAVGRMMDIANEQDGMYYDWGDPAPDWVIRNCLGGANGKV